MGTAEQPTHAWQCKAAFLGWSFQPCHCVNVQSLASRGHLAQLTPNQKWSARHPMGVSKYTVNIAPSMGAPLQPPTSHLLESCDISSQPTLAVPKGCSSGVASCNGASMGWLLQGQQEDGAGGQQQEQRMALPAVRGAGSIPVWHLDTAPSSLLSHGSHPRLKLRSCCRAA